MKIFWTFFGLDSIVFAVLFYFFLIGLADGSVSSFNMALWLPLMLVPPLVLWGGLRLKASGRPGAANGLLALVAVPGVLLGGWMLLLIAAFEMQPGAFR